MMLRTGASNDGDNGLGNGLGNGPFPLPVPGSGPVTVDVRPIFECWAPVGNHYTAYFSYENFSVQGTRLVGVKVDRGSSNRLTPGMGVDLPERFGVPGVVPGRPGRTAFGAALPKAFVVRNWNGTNSLVWKLGTRTATASKSGPQCPVVVGSSTTTTTKKPTSTSSSTSHILNVVNEGGRIIYVDNQLGGRIVPTPTEIYRFWG